MDEKTYYEHLSNAFKIEGKELSYDNLFTYYKSFLSGFVNGIVKGYNFEVRYHFNKYVHIKENSNGVIDIDALAHEMTENAISYYRNNRTRRINVSQSFIDSLGCPSYSVIKANPRGSHILRWNPKTRDYEEVVRLLRNLDDGTYVNYAEYFKVILDYIKANYPDANKVLFYDINDPSTSMRPKDVVTFARMVCREGYPLGMCLTDSKLADYNFYPEASGEVIMDDYSKGIKKGLLVSKKSLDNAMTKCDIIVSGYSLESDIPKQFIKQ